MRNAISQSDCLRGYVLRARGFGACGPHGSIRYRDPRRTARLGFAPPDGTGVAVQLHRFGLDLGAGNCVKASRLFPLLDFVLPAYVAEGKSHLTIAIGCTGGRHRSLTVADRIARHLREHEDVSLRVVHRDVEVD